MYKGGSETRLSPVHPIIGFIPMLNANVAKGADASQEAQSRKDLTNRYITECAPIGADCARIQLPHFIEIL